MGQLTVTKQDKQSFVSVVEDALSKRSGMLRSMRVSQETLQGVLMNVLVRSPQIAKCTKPSIYGAIYRACEMGILPDGRHGAIVPVKMRGVMTADFWPMYPGLATLVRRHIKDVALRCDNVHAVLEGDELVGDEWIDERGTRPSLTHRPSFTIERTPDTLLASYATAHFPTNDVPEFEVMYRDELLKFQKSNKGPWATHPLEMFRTRPFKRLMKKLPLTGDLALIGMQINEELDGDADLAEGDIIEGDVVDVSEHEPTAAARQPARSAAKKPAGRAAKPKQEPKPEPEQEPEDDDGYEVLDEDSEGAW